MPEEVTEFELHKCYNKKNAAKHSLLQRVRRQSVVSTLDQNAKGLIYFLALL